MFLTEIIKKCIVQKFQNASIATTMVYFGVPLKNVPIKPYIFYILRHRMFLFQLPSLISLEMSIYFHIYPI